ncbi:DUF3987 domain-containing protein [Jiella sonneratiae]|uniref:DUF3987 domain-containing protein n=1 Tax=Jiella sonneratiae TaxID=2816856 RepID=A0ABS3J307_9HYPH|nr:DUF3987 domain-containing protein [Jiella sonneratiae]MBO0904051.1 DUF3987 domain-containing protein [Jiella sonneratiae]
MLEENRRLIIAGAALHPLRSRSKAPIDDDWSNLPRTPYAQLQKRFKRSACNIGLRLGEPSVIDGHYLHAADVDIHDKAGVAEVEALLTTMFGTRWRMFPRQKSGSAGASFHIFFLCPVAFRSVKLARSDRMTRRASGKRGRAWEIELFGTGKQVAMAPSIHPDTGKPYRWEIPFDLFDGIPVVEADVLAPYVYVEDSDHLSDERLELSEDEVADWVARLEDWDADDRETWIETAMAIKHELGDAGLPIFLEFSRRCPDKFDLRVARQQYRSIRNNESRGKLITMRTVIQRVHDTEHNESMAENREFFEEIEDDGPPPMSRREITRLFDDDDAEIEIDRDGLSKSKPEKRSDDPDMSILAHTSTPAPVPDLDYIFTAGVADFLRDMSVNSKGAVDFSMCSAMYSVAVAIGNAIQVQLKPGFMQPSTFWGMIIGAPSVKKTPSISPFARALTGIESDHMSVWHIRHEQWDEDKAIAEAVYKRWKAACVAAREKGEDAPARFAGSEIPPEPPQPRLITTNATIEAMALMQFRQPRGVGVVSQELGQWIGDHERYSASSDRGEHLKSYDADETTIDRVKYDGKPVHIPRFNQSIIGGIQPDKLLQLTSLQNADDGLVSRFMPFWPEWFHIDAHKSAPDRSVRLEKMLRKLNEDIPMADGAHGPVPHVIPFSRKASHLFNEWINERVRTEARGAIRLQSVYAKSEGLIGRIALWLWALEHGFDFGVGHLPEQFDVSLVERAIFFRETYLKPMQRRVWQHATETQERKNARHVAEWIVENKPERVNLSQLRREAGIPGMTSRSRAEEMEEAANMLITLNWLYPITQDRRGTKGGRPSKDYGINPRLWELLGK